MIDYKYFDLFLENSIPKQVTVEFDGAVLTNDDLYNQEMELEESLCSEEALRFGSCEASVLKFKVSNIFLQMAGKWLDVKLKLEGDPDTVFPLGKYKVGTDKDSDRISADRKYREIVAYDAMRDILDADVSAWYNALLPDEGSAVTMKQFRESFLRHFGLTEIIPEGGLANDGMVIGRTINPKEISGRDVISPICEINGCFGHIGRDGKFHYIYMEQDIGGLYPSDGLFPDHAPEHLAQSKTGHLYPQDPDSYRIGKSGYIECEFGEFTKRITKLQIRNSENDIGIVWPEGEVKPEDNCYVIEDNFLVYGKTDQQLREIAKNIFDRITDITYMPFTADVIGNPCLEVGDAVRIPTKYDIVESYVLKRTLKGIQALRDEIGADGVGEYGDKVNGVQKSIIQLKGKTNTLKRTVDETVSEIYAIDENGERVSRIEQNANAIGLEVKRATDKEEELSSSIKIEADRITSTVSKATSKFDTTGYEIELFGYVSPDDENMQYKANENNGKYYLNQMDGNLYQSDGISWVHIKSLKLISTELSSRIEQTIKSISMQVKNGEKTAGIVITLESEDGTTENIQGTIEMNGLVTFRNLTGEDGETRINGALLETGTVSCDTLNGGTINGQKIVGGEVNGATVKAKEGLYLKYTNTNTIPPTSGEYVFAKTGYGYEGEVGGVGNSAYLVFNTPSGGGAVVIGTMQKDGANLGNMAYFPDGAIMNSAKIKNILLTYSMENSFIAEEDGTVKNVHEAYLQAKVFGAFVCVYGKYMFREHAAGEVIDITVGGSSDTYIPKWANVEVCTSYRGNPFVFILRTDGVLRVINASANDAIASGGDAGSYITINFRFDFIRT